MLLLSCFRQSSHQQGTHLPVNYSVLHFKVKSLDMQDMIFGLELSLGYEPSQPGPVQQGKGFLSFEFYFSSTA